MPPILAPLATAPAAAAPAVAPKPASASPSAEVAIPAAAPTPVEKPHVVALAGPPVVHHSAKFTALVKHLTTAHLHAETHVRAKTHLRAETHLHADTHRVAARVVEPSLPPGMPMPPPGYYEPGYAPGPGPYQRLVYGGPPPGAYGGWGGYRGRWSYYP